MIVETLCGRGANMNIMDGDGNCPLWQALDTGQEDIAQILVREQFSVVIKTEAKVFVSASLVPVYLKVFVLQYTLVVAWPQGICFVSYCKVVVFF